MKKLVCSALALSTTTVLGFASDDEWSQLDREVEALTSSLALDNHVGISGWLRARYDNSSDLNFDPDPVNPPDEEEVSGFTVPEVRFLIEGNNGDYGYYVQYDFSDGESFSLTDSDADGSADNYRGGLLDAYGEFSIGGSIKGRIGRFKPPVLRSALRSRKDQFFLNKTANGEAWTTRDEGFQLSGAYDIVSWYLAVMNGSDGTDDDLLIAGRLGVDFLGEGGINEVEGAYGAADDIHGSFGIAFFDDAGAEDSTGGSGEGDGFVVDINFASSTYSFGAEIVDLGEDVAASGVAGYGSGFYDAGGNIVAQDFADAVNGPGGLLNSSLPLIKADGDSTSFAGTFTYMFVPEQWEAGIRYQDYDDSASTTSIEAGLNYYMNGHDTMWSLNFVTFDSDEEGIEIDFIALAMTLGV